MKLTRQNIRTLAMPLAMVVGVALCRPLDVVERVTEHTLTPVLIAAMLFITFCRVDVRQMRLSWSHLWMLLIQFLGATLVYYAITPLLGAEVGQGAMICVMAPIAMAAAKLLPPGAAQQSSTFAFRGSSAHRTLSLEAGSCT